MGGKQVGCKALQRTVLGDGYSYSNGYLVTVTSSLGQAARPLGLQKKERSSLRWFSSCSPIAIHCKASLFRTHPWWPLLFWKTWLHQVADILSINHHKSCILLARMQWPMQRGKRFLISGGHKMPCHFRSLPRSWQLNAACHPMVYYINPLEGGPVGRVCMTLVFVLIEQVHSGSFVQSRWESFGLVERCGNRMK